MVNSDIRFTFILLATSFFIFTFYLFYFQSGISISPSFSRQEIIDNINDWNAQYGPCNATDYPIIEQLYSAPNIQAVSYNSDGKTLNGTIFLNNSFNDFLSSSLTPDIIYHMVIQPPSYYDPPTRHKGVYVDEVYYDHMTGNWSREVYEQFSNSSITKVIYADSNHTGFYDKDKKQISFSLDLNWITSPMEYLVSFAAIVDGNANGEKCRLKDDTDWYQIPIPQFTISSSPTSIELKPGEEKNIELKVTSPLKRSGNSTVTLSINPISGLRISPISSTISIPRETSGFVFFNIKASEDLRDDTLPETHTLIMNVSITIPRFTQQQVGSDINSGSLTNTISKTYSDLTITILKRMTFDEKFIGFWNTYGSVISLVGGGFAAGFAALIFDRINKKREGDTK